MAGLGLGPPGVCWGISSVRGLGLGPLVYVGVSGLGLGLGPLVYVILMRCYRALSGASVTVINVAAL